MARCPRCGGEADRLHRLPPEVLAGNAGRDTGASERRACRWCIHEVTEG